MVILITGFVKPLILHLLYGFLKITSGCVIQLRKKNKFQTGLTNAYVIKL
ncbi:Uncharacterised protein [Klebsiella pneumoniae]|nr:Uncharacterised protein [Klebsiella pneumoniae]